MPVKKVSKMAFAAHNREWVVQCWADLRGTGKMGPIKRQSLEGQLETKYYGYFHRNIP
jgi:hypothetical protein